MINLHREVGIEPAPKDFDVKTSVAIIGGGGCGLTAAIASAQSGAETVIFERDIRPSGSTGMSYGSVCAAGTKLQEREGVSDSVDNLVADILEATQGQTDPDHVRAMAKNARDALNWITEDLQLDFSIEKNWTGYGHRIPRLHGTPLRSGEEMIAMLASTASDAGATLVTQADVSTIFVNENGIPCGLKYCSPDGELTVAAKAIIIASSGFAANSNIVKDMIPEMQNATYYGAEWHQGDALAWANHLDIELADLGSYQSLGNLAIPHNIVIPHTVLIDGGFAVNIAGSRFHNELENISGQALRVLDQPEGFCWLIYDQKGHDKAKALFEEYRRGLEVKAYKSADKVEKLAARLKLPVSEFTASFKVINNLVNNEETDSFGRKFKNSHKLEPPFYAVKVTGALFHTQGGICVDESARVRKTDGTIIPNLFAGGGAIRGVSGPGEWGYLPGMGLCTAIAFGWRAGIEAASLVQSSEAT